MVKLVHHRGGRQFDTGGSGEFDISGFWGMAHDARTEWSMLLGILFLLISGPGRFSLDGLLARRLQTARPPQP